MAVLTKATRLVWAFLLLAACGDSVTVNGVVKGALGESCRARNDCDVGLFCRDLVCTNASPSPGGDGGLLGSTRGERGETCQRRDDCQAPLACIGNVCTDAPVDAGTTDFSSSGKRGEDCESTRDCAAGLVCVNGRCRESDFGLDYTPKVCETVECAATADCCKVFEATRGYTVAECNMMKATCEAGAALSSPPYECSNYRYYCACPSRCDQELCKPQVGTSCLISLECTALNFAGGCVGGRCAECSNDSQCQVAGKPYCVGNQCVACKTNDQCMGASQTCVMGVCQNAGCTLNEHCGKFEACQGGKCVDVGCSSDRECFFDTGNERAKCQNKKCTSPCESDAECGEAFSICHEGNCQFVGCNTDEECRLEQDLTMQSSTSVKRAVCREPKL